MSKKTTLIVVRHGNTFNSGDVILRVGGKTDLPLTEKGIAQGEAVGKELLAQGFDVDMIFSAPLLRTMRSAQGIAASFPGVPEVQKQDFLTELEYGVDDGAPEDDVVIRIGMIEKLADITAETTIDELRAFGKAALKRWDNEAVLPAAWAHLQQKAAMLNAQWQEFATLVAGDFAGKTVVAVTSNGIARFSKAILPAGSAIPENLKLATGAFGVYTFDGVWALEQWNVRPQI